MSDSPATAPDTCYLLQNQDGYFLGKNLEWLDGREPGPLFKTRHKDEAVNQAFEASSRDYTQRIHPVPCPTNSRGLPVIDPQILPPRLSDQAPATADSST